MGDQYKFTQNWFQLGAAEQWAELIPSREPKTYLEIGSYEGTSACWMIEKTQVDQIVCIDTWSGGQEHVQAGIDMQGVERRFDENIAVAGGKVAREISVTKLKDPSLAVLTELISQGMSNTFDVVYVDGSHEPCDVLSDAVLAYAVCRPGGLLIFDDYQWWDQTSRGVASSPKLAIDAFTTCFFDHIQILPAKLRQVYCIKKISSSS